MDLDRLGDNWERFGEVDPLWAVLTGAEKRGGRWDEDEFFATAEHELGTVTQWLEEWIPEAWESVSRDRALDFGCGVGRLTLWLGSHFNRCDGVDIADSMVQRARKYADRRTGGQNCIYHRNDREDLALFVDDSFDFIYTAHVLQHMRPDFARSYVREFVRVLRPGGLAVFQLPVGAPPPPEILPDEAFGNRSTVKAITGAVTAGDLVEIDLEIENTGDHTWPAFSSSGFYQLEIWCRWVRSGAAPLGHVRFVPAAALGQDIDPGGFFDVRLRFPAPPSSGEWALQIGLVQVGARPFAVHPSGSLSETIRVEGVSTVTKVWRGTARLLRQKAKKMLALNPKLADAAATIVRKARMGDRATRNATSEEPVMEMYATASDEVSRWVTEAGGRVIAQADWCALFDQRPTDWARGLFVVTSAPAEQVPAGSGSV